MIFNSFTAVIDGLDACGKGTIINELNKNLYHRTPEGQKENIDVFSARPATRLATVDKDKTDEYENNMYEYMDAFLIGRLCKTISYSREFLPETIRKPTIKINDRGLLSTFFYAYVHDDGGYDYAKMIKELIADNKPASKSKKSETTLVSTTTREEIANRLVARYIKFESVIRDRLKVLLNSYDNKKIQFKSNCEEFYKDLVIHFNHCGVDIGSLIEELHTDITVAVCCNEELSDKVIEKRHILHDDSKQYEQIFETNEVFRKNTNLVYNFFMTYCLPKLDAMNYVNPFIGHIVKVYTSQTFNGEIKWRKPTDINRDIVSWWNYYLSTNNFTTLGYKGHEQYRFQTCTEYIPEEEY